MKFLKQVPVQLVISITIAFILGSILDVAYISFFYSLSSCFIKALIFILPIMVFSFIFKALINNKSSPLYLLILIFTGVTISNCIALLVAYFFGITFLPFAGLQNSPEMLGKFVSKVPLLFQLNLPELIGTETAMGFGLFLGILISFLKEDNQLKIFSRKIFDQVNSFIHLFLQKIFIPLLPLYVFGFCLKLSYDQTLIELFQQFGKVFLLSFLLVIGYIYFLYFLGSGKDFKRTQKNLQNMLPAGLTGFCTMSSAATLPVTLNCTEKNIQDRNFTDLIISSTANIHMLGDDLNLMMMTLSLLTIFGMPWPDILTIIPFIFAFSLAKLSCVGVPGASVLVVLPVLQSHLHFTPEMISILTTIYILQDCFGASANVMGNGALALIIQRIFYGKRVVKEKIAA